MFFPNRKGLIARRQGRNVHGEEIWGPNLPCPYAVVNMNVAALKTSVRADSSASRGSADETVAERAGILVPFYIDLAIDDRFTMDGETFRIVGRNPRYAVSGRLDHYQLSLEVIP